jgi:glyoxylase-like metal-dependent hydrolase (beta-lactamase superfamily II)
VEDIMILECIPYGLFGSNCYIVGDKGEAVVIDPGCDSDNIIEAAKKNNLSIKYIIITHGHIDHLASVEEVRKKTGAEVLIHENDADKLTDPSLNDALGMGLGVACKKADRLLHDGDRLTVGGIDFEIIHTPGHSAGGICIKAENKVFTGDTLFKMGIGRTDLLDGDMETLFNSIRTKLFTLDDGTVVYPGHGEPTTIGAEKRGF